MADPPENPDDWTEDQWCEWLQAEENAAMDDPPVMRRRPTISASIIGAGLLGLEKGMFGRVDEPEIVMEIEDDGQDDGLVVLDPEDPSKSVINVPGPHEPPHH